MADEHRVARLAAVTARSFALSRDSGRQPPNSTTVAFPAASITTDAEGRSFVWLVDDEKRAVQVPVELGAFGGDVSAVGGLGVEPPGVVILGF